jgi:Fic family protein
MSKSSVEYAPKFEPSKDLDNFGEVYQYFDDYEATDKTGRYLHWSQLKWRVPKGEEQNIWKAVKFKRMSLMKPLLLKDEKDAPFTYCTPHSMEAMLHQVVKLAGGNVAGNVGNIDDSGSSDRIQNRFLVSSLIMEEAITSAQLEGASTTREVAKKMLEDEREPVDEDERMIVNNYLLLKYAESIKSEELSIDQILEFHRIATFGTTENNVCPGEFREDNEIYVRDGNGNIAHQPPDFSLIHDRLLLLCEFANTDHSGLAGSAFIAPIVKAIILHFMIGYEHPFRDGNGRTARALFYWYMLKCEYKLFRYVSISKLLKEKPKEYGLSFMYTERDQNDLTYFIYFQLEIILSAFQELESYLNDKVTEFQKIAEMLDETKWGEELNFIQKDLLKKG